MTVRTVRGDGDDEGEDSQRRRFDFQKAVALERKLKEKENVEKQLSELQVLCCVSTVMVMNRWCILAQ